MWWLVSNHLHCHRCFTIMLTWSRGSVTMTIFSELSGWTCSDTCEAVTGDYYGWWCDRIIYAPDQWLFISCSHSEMCWNRRSRHKSEFSNKILVKQAVMLTLIFNNYPFISFWELKSEFYIVMSVFSIISWSSSLGCSIWSQWMEEISQWTAEPISIKKRLQNLKIFPRQSMTCLMDSIVEYCLCGWHWSWDHTNHK